MKLVLENKDGKTVRTFVLNGEQAHVVQRRDTRRLEIHATLDTVNGDYVAIANFARKDIAAGPLPIREIGQLRLVEAVGEIHRDGDTKEANSNVWHASLAFLILLMAGFLTFILNRPLEDAKVEQEMRHELVQIIKRAPPPPKSVVGQAMEQKAAKPAKQVDFKRLGALSILGRLAKSKQTDGVNLDAVKTTTGPGLGGTQGSGGTQATLFGKGLVAAPAVAGANLQGGGGYGTKGKGGGQEGYGKLSMVGAGGTAAIPLGREASVESGLDREAIAGVINRNMGQVRFCYEQALQTDPSLAGRVAIGFTIAGNGRVKSAGIESTSLNSKLVEDCLLLRLRTWQFPLPRSGVDVKVSYPFVLRRAGQG